MSYLLNGTNQRLQTASAPVAAFPFTWTFWWKQAAAAAYGIVSCGANANDNSVRSGTGTDNTLRAVSRGTADVTALSSNIITDYTKWQVGAGRFFGANRRDVMLNSVITVDENTGAITFAPNNLRVGETQAGAGDFAGRIAHVALWDGELSDSDLLRIAAGASPLSVSRIPKCYWPLVNDARDIIGGFDFTVTGATLDADNPPVSNIGLNSVLLTPGGRLKTGPGPIVSYFRSLPMNAAGEIVAGNGPITSFCQGWPRNAAGAVVGLLAAQPTDYGPGALPYGPNGEIIGGGAATPIAFYQQGLPYDSAGRFAGTVTPGVSVVAQDFNIVPEVISSTSVGYRAAPLVGQMTPDTYAGGTVILVQATDTDHLRVQNTGGVPFPGIAGNLTVQLPAYVGPNRIILGWVAASGWYEWLEPGIYNHLLSFVGTGIPMRFSAAPAGS